LPKVDTEPQYRKEISLGKGPGFEKRGRKSSQREEIESLEERFYWGNKPNEKTKGPNRVETKRCREVLTGEGHRRGQELSWEKRE